LQSKTKLPQHKRQCCRHKKTYALLIHSQIASNDRYAMRR